MHIDYLYSKFNFNCKIRGQVVNLLQFFANSSIFGKVLCRFIFYNLSGKKWRIWYNKQSAPISVVIVKTKTICTHREIISHKSCCKKATKRKIIPTHRFFLFFFSIFLMHVNVFSYTYNGFW